MKPSLRWPALQTADSQIARRRLTAALLAASAIAVCATGTGAWAETPAEKGRAIAREMDRRDQGFGDSRVDLKMILKNRAGQTSTRQLRMSTLEVAARDDGDKILIVFERPGDIEGTALLSYTHIARADDQWLFLPALKRVKRISSANKSGPFVGSEFAYEDMLSQEVAKYTYRWLRDEPCGALSCFVVERIPVYENSGYTRQVVWIDREQYSAMKIAFFDRKGDVLKTLQYKGYRKYLDRYWRPDELFMENHQTGKTTTLAFSDYGFRVGVKARDFTPGRLKRSR